VLYELLSGRIPYEGPDTKTTNSFVVKGDAPPPSHYDSSVPEPLSDVTMRALSSGSGNRMRDGADAEAALKEAWERCLKEGLVSPMALAGEEMAHEKVGSTMHGGVTNPQGSQWGGPSTKVERPPPTPQPTRTPDGSEADDGLSTARRDPQKGPPTRPAGKPKASKKADEGPYVIETRGKERVGDDDPTRILVREREEPRTERDPSSAVREREKSPAVAKKPSSPAAGAIAKKKSAPPAASTGDVVGPGDGTPAWLIAMIVIIVLGAGAVATWWFRFR
jgi:hypothetical protein